MLVFSVWACKKLLFLSSSSTRNFFHSETTTTIVTTKHHRLFLLLSFKSVDVELLFDENYCSFIVDVAVVFWLVMTATGTLLVKYRSSTHNNIKSSSSSSHQLHKRQRRQANLLTRKYFNIARKIFFILLLLLLLFFFSFCLRSIEVMNNVKVVRLATWISALAECTICLYWSFYSLFISTSILKVFFRRISTNVLFRLTKFL